MHVQNVIEITQTDGLLPAAVIITAYRASRYGLVVFVLNDVAPAAIDVILDPVVSTMPLSIPGVLYVHMSDEARVCQAVTSAETVYAATEAFRNLAVGYGAPPGNIRSVLTSELWPRKRVRLTSSGEARGLPPMRPAPTRAVLYRACRTRLRDGEIARA
ncbi:hypothetical protein [Sinorhizobium terangae]|uniref:Uncharacterized protein n=1 Tax=Sinorhizobium terangae TaxID=110322 RepID=A0A6N7LK26_SINTE|nr:hypothetical protein [Sinorhizobium terangae]MBB4189121.1 hypothetical protein [Sinorhizobium terangae]MQX17976.1 hypothetical protein [Sinorhizobium terangae]WFU46819.1 hypothetical protein QA637_13090 [Sinorhizobium terangae]